MNCISEACVFRTHSNIRNNGGSYCCARCKATPGKHGPACEQSMLFDLSTNSYYAPFAIYDDTNYTGITITKNNTGSGAVDRVKVFCGRNVVMVIDKDNIGTNLDISEGSVLVHPIIDMSQNDTSDYHTAMGIIINSLDKLIDLYISTIGMTPVARPYRGINTRVEIAFINAGGLASHGVTGMACGPAFLMNFFKSCLKYVRGEIPQPYFEQIFTYELCRNFIFPEVFTPVFDYRCYAITDRGSSNPSLDLWQWGWVNQGFVNALGSLVVQKMQPPMNYNYAGYDISGFWMMFERELDTYIAGVKDTSYNWVNTFMFHRLIWSATDSAPYGAKSLDNLYSGILIRLWKNYGKNKFLLRFFKALNYMSKSGPNTRSATYLSNRVNRSVYMDTLSTSDTLNKLNYQTASENFYIAASYGAGKNLQGKLAAFSNITPFYTPLTPEAITYCKKLLKRKL